MFRRWEHQHLTFSMLYAWNENFVLPFSHDEVVHGKGALINKIAGDAWQKAATLRTLYAFMYVHPGQEAAVHGQRARAGARVEPRRLARLAPARAIRCTRACSGSSRISTASTAPSRRSTRSTSQSAGFEWIDCNDYESSVISLIRRGVESATTGSWPCSTGRRSSGTGYRVGVPEPGYYAEVLNSDAAVYGGGNVGNRGGLHTDPTPAHGHAQSLSLTLPPLGRADIEKTYVAAGYVRERSSIAFHSASPTGITDRRGR